MLRVAIVEDEEIEAKRVIEFISRFQAESHEEFDVRHFSDARSFLNNSTTVFDIVLMDIRMPHMNGMEAAHELRKRDNRTVIIFLTNLAQYAVKGYEVSALDFIIKPVSYPVFTLKFKRAVEVAILNVGHTVNIMRAGELFRIPTSDVIFVEVSGHELCYHLKGMEVRDWGSLNALEKEFAPYHFMRCNSCYLVNPQHIRRIINFTVIMDNGAELQISHPKKKAFMSAMTKWMGENQA